MDSFLISYAVQNFLQHPCNIHESKLFGHGAIQALTVVWFDFGAKLVVKALDGIIT